MGRPAGSKNKTTVSQAVEEAVDELKQDIPQIVEDAVKEALEEVKADDTTTITPPIVPTEVTPTVPVTPMIEYSPQPETIGIPKGASGFVPKDASMSPLEEKIYGLMSKVPEESVLVDKKLFCKMVRSLVVEQTRNYTGFAAIRNIGQMLGAKTFEEEQEWWQKIKSEKL